MSSRSLKFAIGQSSYYFMACLNCVEFRPVLLFLVDLVNSTQGITYPFFLNNKYYLRAHFSSTDSNPERESYNFKAFGE